MLCTVVIFYQINIHVISIFLFSIGFVLIIIILFFNQGFLLDLGLLNIMPDTQNL